MARQFSLMEVDTITYLNSRGYGNTEIGNLIGRSESSIRSLLNRKSPVRPKTKPTKKTNRKTRR